MSEVAANLRRLMVRLDLTIAQVVRRTGVDTRTIKGMLSGEVRPHARTLHRLATGLGVAADELFQNPSVLAYRLFDRWTNPVVDEVAAGRPDLFDGWIAGDFDELYPGLFMESVDSDVRQSSNWRCAQVTQNTLFFEVRWFAGGCERMNNPGYSRFGVGGPLTQEGVREAASAMNRNRELHRKLAVVLETSQAELAAQIVDAFYRRIVVSTGTGNAVAKLAKPEESARVDGLPAPATFRIAQPTS